LVLAPDKINQKFPGQPEVQASILETVGKTYRAIGEYGKSAEFLRRASDLYQSLPAGGTTNALNAMNTLVLTYLDEAKPTEAIALAERVRDARVKGFGREHLATLDAMNNLGIAYLDAGKTAQAAELFDQVYKGRAKELGTNHLDTINTLNNRALAYQESGKLPVAIDLFEQARPVATRALGPDHPLTLRILHNLAFAYQKAGKRPQATELFEQCRDAQVRTLGPDHPETLLTMEGLATEYKESRRFAEAIALLEKVRDGRIKRYGPEHTLTLQAMMNLASAYRMSGRVTEAIALNEHIRDADIRILGPDDPDTLTTLNNLAVSYQDAGRVPEAINVFQQLFETCNRKLGPDHPNTLGTLENFARAEQAAHNPNEALKHFRLAVERYETSSRFHGPTDSAYNGVGQCLEELHEYDEAEVWRQKWVTVARERSGADSLPYASAMANLGLNLLKQGKWAAAESAARESFRIREKSEPELWSTFNSRSLVGGALLGQKRFGDAEPFLVSGYEGMKAREATIPRLSKIHLKSALERLIQLYSDWDKAEPGSGKLAKVAPLQKQLEDF
jgi:tetratricopeptide (TPR) repeat protein